MSTDKKDFDKKTAANLIAYRVQDLLDGFSNGRRFIFADFEKDILKLLENTE